MTVPATTSGRELENHSRLKLDFAWGKSVQLSRRRGAQGRWIRPGVDGGQGGVINIAGMKSRGRLAVRGAERSFHYTPDRRR